MQRVVYGLIVHAERARVWVQLQEVARCKQERSAAEAARATQQSQLEDLRSERPGAGEDDAADLLAGNRDELARLQGELAELEAQVRSAALAEHLATPACLQ